MKEYDLLLGFADIGDAQIAEAEDEASMRGSFRKRRSVIRNTVLTAFVCVFALAAAMGISTRGIIKKRASLSAPQAPYAAEDTTPPVRAEVSGVAVPSEEGSGSRETTSVKKETASAEKETASGEKRRETTRSAPGRTERETASRKTNTGDRTRSSAERTTAVPRTAGPLTTLPQRTTAAPTTAPPTTRPRETIAPSAPETTRRAMPETTAPSVPGSPDTTLRPMAETTTSEPEFMLADANGFKKILRELFERFGGENASAPEPAQVLEVDGVVYRLAGGPESGVGGAVGARVGTVTSKSAGPGGGLEHVFVSDHAPFIGCSVYEYSSQELNPASGDTKTGFAVETGDGYYVYTRTDKE